jgi:phosphatidylcholine synthase
MRTNESGIQRIARRSAAMVMLQVRKRRKKPQPRGARPPSTFEKTLGWCVHGYTALGLVAAGLIAVLLVRGGADAFRWSFLLMAIATIVDATDGTLARKVRIKEVVPGFDGRRLDDIVDFLTYTFLPLLLIWRAEILPAGYEAWLFLPLLASVYGFCQVHAKTDDGYFLGFPSLWNLVALYLYVLHLYELPQCAWVSLAIVIVLALLTFVPIRHLYPSQPGLLNRVSMLAGVVWTPLVGWLIWKLPGSGEPRLSTWTFQLALLSFLYPVYYLGVSWVISLMHWRKQLSYRRLRV